MRRLIGTLVAGTVLTLVAGTSAADSSASKARARVAGVTKRSRPLCPPHGHGRILLKTGRAVLFLKPEYITRSGRYRGTEVYGCTYDSRKAYRIGLPGEYTSSGGGGVALETLAGTMVAYENSGSGPESSPYYQVIVQNLRTGRIVHNEETGTQTERMGIGPCYSLVVKRDGAVAWIAEDEWTPSKEYQVHVVDRLGSRVVSSGTEIEGKSLRLVGSALSWVQGGRRQTAVLH